MQSHFSEATESKLFENIHTLESNQLTDSNTSTALRDLRSQYNQLIDARNQQFHHPNYLEYLPNEIWTHVFLRLAEDDGLDILPSMQVCQHWTSIIVSEPRLWTSIYFRDDNIEFLELAYSALCLSKDFPLDVTIEFRIDSNIQIPLLQREASRIQYLRLETSAYFPDSGKEQFIKFIANLLKDLSPLPSLHSLTVGGGLTGDANFWSSILVNLDAAQIRYVQPAVFSQDVLSTSRYTQIRHLATSSALETLLPELVKFSDLRRLSLLARPKLNESISTSEMSIDSYKDIALLKSLRYSQEFSDVTWPLLKHVSSSLRVLQLEITWEQLPKLFTVMQDTQSLYEVSLFIPLSSIESKSEDSRWKAPALPQIRMLALELTRNGMSRRIDDLLDFSREAHVVVEALENSFPHVRTLYLGPRIYANDLVRLTRTMENLTSLNVEWIDPSHQSEKATCPTLKTVTTGDPMVLCHLIMPNLTSITIGSTRRIDEMENDPLDRSFVSTVQSIAMKSEYGPTILANGSEFTQLHTLQWYDNYHGYHYQDDSFPSLTKIIFNGGLETANAFCESLLRYPRLCPLLETIYFADCPEWDTLLYMLLRRNTHHRPNNLSRITRIRTLGYPAPCILAPLRDLLLGKIPLDMPSPEELSVVGIEDIYFDPTVYVVFIFTYARKNMNLY
jgi:hypothetical protein